MATPGITFSITTPKQLEEYLSEEAKKVGVSRSRFIVNRLLDWQDAHRKADNRFGKIKIKGRK